MRPSSNRLRAPLALIAVAVLAACASKKPGTPDNEPTLKVLAGRTVDVAPDGGIKATPEQTIAAYRKFLEIAPKATQRPEAMRRIGDLEMDSADNKLADGDSRVHDSLERIGAYIRTDFVPSAAVVKQAKLAVVIDAWMSEYDITASAIQCWTSLQQNYGVNVCTIMSMMSEALMPSACEVDVTGVTSMFALQLAHLTPAALVDWLTKR